MKLETPCSFQAWTALVKTSSGWWDSSQDCTGGCAGNLSVHFFCWWVDQKLRIVVISIGWFYWIGIKADPAQIHHREKGFVLSQKVETWWNPKKKQKHTFWKRNNLHWQLYFSFCLSLLQFVVIASTLTSSGLKYDEYNFPNWSNLVGWGIAMSSMLFVPFYAIYKFFSLPGSFKEVGAAVN